MRLLKGFLMTTEIPTLLTREEVADLLGVTTETLRIWRADPEMAFPPPLRLSARTTRWTAEQITDWLASRMEVN